MKLSLNGATTMKADLPTDIRAAAAAGFEYVEIWSAKLRKFLAGNSPADLKALFAESGVKPLSINSIEHITFRDAEAYAKIKAECEELCAIAAKIKCPYIVVVPGKLLPEMTSSSEIIEESVRVLRDLASIAERFGVALAFEFLGEKDCSVQKLDLADEIVEKVNRPNIGLVIDSFHFYTGGSTIDMIDAMEAKRLLIFHIDDAEDLPRVFSHPTLLLPITDSDSNSFGNHDFLQGGLRVFILGGVADRIRKVLGRTPPRYPPP